MCRPSYRGPPPDAGPPGLMKSQELRRNVAIVRHEYGIFYPMEQRIPTVLRLFSTVGGNDRPSRDGLSHSVDGGWGMSARTCRAIASSSLARTIKTGHAAPGGESDGAFCR